MTPATSLPVRSLCVAVLLAATGACLEADTTPPVASVTFTPSRTRVALGSPVDLTYKFDVAPGAAIPGDYTVFVHVVGDDGQQLWADDHLPPVPTSQWKPGQTIGPYTRLKFVPLFPYVGHATVIVGLYKGDARLPISTGLADERLRLKTRIQSRQPGTAAGHREMFASSCSADGTASKFLPNNPTLEWQWSQKAGVISFQNPKKDVTRFTSTPTPGPTRFRRRRP